MHSPMFKADVNTASTVLTKPFRSVWEDDTVPDDWCKTCYNWGLITQL